MKIKKLAYYAIQNEKDINKLRKFTTSQLERQLESILAVGEYIKKIEELEKELEFYKNQYKSKSQKDKK